MPAASSSSAGPLFIISAVASQTGTKPPSVGSRGSAVSLISISASNDGWTSFGRSLAPVPPVLFTRIGLRLNERIRPDVPDDAQGWNATGELRLERIHSAVG